MLEEQTYGSADLEWWNLQSEFNNYLSNQASMPEYAYNNIAEYAKNSLREVTQISDVEYDIFIRRFNALFNDYKNISISFDYFINDVMNKRKTDVLLQQVVEMEFFKLTICEETNSTPGTVIIEVPAVKEEVCNSPIELSNIIPI